MAKVFLLITESFPPVENIAAQRFPPMLSVLEARGWEVWVLTKNGKGMAPLRFPSARLIRIGRHHQEGWKIQSGSHFARDSRIRAASRAAYRFSGLILRSVDSSLLTWGREVRRELSAIRRRLPNVDLIMGSYGPAAALWLARWLGAVYQAPWIADFRDPGALRQDGRAGYAQWLDARLEANLLHSAAAVTTCGEHWAASLRRAYGRPTHVIYNGWDVVREGAALELSEAISAHDGPYLYFAGRFYERQMEAVFRLLQALRATPFQLVIRSLGPSEREQEITGRAEQLGVREQVTLLPPVAHAWVLAEARNSAANLVLENVHDEPEWMSGHLSGKFLQLLPLAPPIVFVARSDAEAGEILRRTGKGTLCTSVEDISRYLAQLPSVKGTMPGMEIDEFSKRRQGERLLDLLDAVHARAVVRRGAGPDALLLVRKVPDS